MGSNPPSSYYIVTRRKQAPFMFQKLPDLCLPFGMKRTPAYQFIARMRDFKPHLKDLLILASTASTDVGLITRSDQPLSDDDAAKQTTGLFTTTEIIDDTKRAEIPLTEAGEETSVIGFGLDLSSTENVVSPIPGEEISESSTPLPNLLLLNNDGILSSWWFVYSDSIRQKMAYHGLSTLSTGPQQQPQQPAAFGTPSPFGAQLGFGKSSATPAFGTPSALGGNRPSTFGTPSALGGGPVLGSSVSKPSFGTPSPLGRATPQFGQSGFGALGQTPSLGQPSTPGFGSISGGGFGSYAKGGGFASLAPQTPPGNPFGKLAAESPFSKLSGTSPFGLTANKDTAFTPQKSKDSTSTGFGLPPGGFVLGSTFKGDGSAVNDGPKPEKPSGMFTLGGDLDEMVSTPTKASPPTEAMDDMEDESTAPEQSPSLSKEPTPTSLGQAQAPLSGAQMKTEQIASAAHVDKALPPEKTPLGGLAPKQEPSVMELPLPPDSTSKAVFGPGDTSASSNVSKSSVEDAPLPPDFLTQPKPAPKSAGEPPLPPDFVAQHKKTEKPEPALEEPLPPEPSPKEEQPISQSLPEDDESEPAEKESGAEEGDSEAEESESEREAEESDFADSGEEITHEVSPTEEEPDLRVRSLKTSPESSFGAPLDKSPGGDLFSRISKPEKVSQLFGEVKPHFPPAQKAREVPRSPSPVRVGIPGRLLRPEGHRSISAPSVPGATLAARKAALTDSAQRDHRLEPRPSSIAREEQARYVAQARREAEEEMLSLSDDDEDERLRSDLAQPAEPVPTLDPFLPHQDYTGGTSKPGVPGQIEKLYRDINSMVDTLGINSRSLISYLLYQQMPNQSNYKTLENILLGDQPTDISEEKLLFVDIEKLDDLVSSLSQSLDERRVKGVEEKLKQCGDILSNDVLTLRAQCAGIQRILDTHTNPASILSAPLSAEQINLQQDLRSASTVFQAKLAELEQGVSLLRARIADAAPDPVTGVRKAATKRPTIEAVSSTISTMMGMAEAKSGDIDVLEAKMKKLGIDISGPSPSSREGSPFTTPKKALGRIPVTPGSRGSRDEAITAYHTPDSASRGLPFRSSINGSARASRLRNMQVAGDFVVRQEGERWKEKARRRRCLLDNLKHAMDEKKSKVRGIDDP